MEALFADWRTVLQVPLITNEYLPLSGNGGINRNLGNSPQRRSKQGRPRCRGVDTKRRFIFAGAAMCESACHFQRHRFSRAPLQIGDGSATDAQLLAGWEISCLTLRAIPAPLDKCKGCEEGYQELSGGARWPWAITGIRQRMDELTNSCASTRTSAPLASAFFRRRPGAEHVSLASIPYAGEIAAESSNVSLSVAGRPSALDRFKSANAFSLEVISTHRLKRAVRASIRTSGVGCGAASVSATTADLRNRLANSPRPARKPALRRRVEALDGVLATSA
jgi:hypothetical protein